MPYSIRSYKWLVVDSLKGLFLQVFNILSLAIEIRSISGIRVYSINKLECKKGKGGAFNYSKYFINLILT